jgi:PAS domain S-box-containing protein
MADHRAHVTLARTSRRERPRDAAESASMQMKREAQAHRWDLAVHSAQFGVWDLDLPADLVHYPPEWKRLLGYPPTDEPDPTSVWRDRVHPDDLPGMMAALGGYLEGRHAAYEAEFRLRSAEGDWRWMLSRGRIVARDAAGRPLRLVGTLTDLTERRAAELMRAERDRAEAANQAKTRFLSRMSHELRTPLNAVLGFAQLLEARLGQADLDDQRRYLTHIQEAGWHLLAMIEDVLDLSGIESGELTLQAAPASLAAIVRASADMLRPMAEAAGVALRVDEPLPGGEALVDARRLRQVLTNLLSNAIKYNRPGGTVDVRVAMPARGGWCIAVADSGLGIAAAKQPHLFEAFNRLGREKDGIEGVGIGLLLTRWIVQRMGGRIEVESEEGVGSTFRVVMPPGPETLRGQDAGR